MKHLFNVGELENNPNKDYDFQKYIDMVEE